MREQLQAYYSRTFPQHADAQIGAIDPISAGWENEVYSFEVTYGPAEARRREELILRIYPGDDARRKSGREYVNMGKLHALGYPVPRMLALAVKDSPLGRPFVIMEKIQGENMWPLLFHSPDPEQQERMLARFCRLFLELHRLDWRPAVSDVSRYANGDPYLLIDRELDWMRSWLERTGIEGFAPLVDWLQARRDRVPCAQPGIIHWDFHPANLLVRADGSAVVLDWTQVTVSDPRFDLAWTLILIGSIVGPGWHDRVLAEYERQAGAPVPELGFFEAYGCLKRLVSVAVALGGNARSIGLRPDLGDIIRQQLPTIRRLYEREQELTGLRLPVVEEFLAEEPS